MSLIDTCADFTEAVSRVDVAAACLKLIEAAAISVKEHVPDDAGPSLIRAIVVARTRSVEEAVRGVRVWTLCEPLALIDSEPWDPLCLLMFLVECHLRVCVTHLYSTKGGWAALGEAPTYDVPMQRVVHADEWRRTPLELQAGLEPRGVAALLTVSSIERSSVALVVCFEGQGLEPEAAPVANDASLNSDSDCEDFPESLETPGTHDDRDNRELVEATEDMGAPPRASRAGVRLLERAFLIDTLRIVIGAELDLYQEMSDFRNDPFEHAAAVEAWMRRTVAVDANNALLLRLDEWAVCCALVPGDVAEAGGERGGVPQEHRNGPSAWVLQRVKTDEDYRSIMAASKRNDGHAENVYMCFAGMLEQHFSFDWATRCLVARINPAVALRKIREYAAVANAKTPPLIVQREGGRATVISAHGRIECATAACALSAWITVVVTHLGGAYTRKANIVDVIERIRRPPERPTINRPEEKIGGESVALRSVLE